jgi:hypothetical protein
MRGKDFMTESSKNLLYYGDKTGKNRHKECFCYAGEAISMNSFNHGNWLCRII